MVGRRKGLARKTAKVSKQLKRTGSTIGKRAKRGATAARAKVASAFGALKNPFHKKDEEE